MSEQVQLALVTGLVTVLLAFISAVRDRYERPFEPRSQARPRPRVQAHPVGGAPAAQVD